MLRKWSVRLGVAAFLVMSGYVLEYSNPDNDVLKHAT